MTDLRSDGRAALDWAADYLERVGDLPVLAQVAPGDIRRQLPTEAPEEPEPFSAVLRDLSEGMVVLIDVSGLGSTEEVLIASYLTRRILNEWSNAYLENPELHERLPVVSVVLEEAQRVLGSSKDKESNVSPRLAREGRKFKVGLTAVTQQPKLLDDELLSQFNTFFILGLADEKDRNILRASSKADLSALGPEIQTLMPGECLVANLSAPFAVPATIHLYEDLVRRVPPPPAARPAAAANVAALVD